MEENEKMKEKKKKEKAPQNPSNVTQSQPLTVTLEGHLSHTAIPLSGELHVD